MIKFTDKYYAAKKPSILKTMAENLEKNDEGKATASEMQERHEDKAVHRGLREARNFSIETHIAGKYPGLSNV